MNKEIICTVCPRGCHINVVGEGDKIETVEGYTCKRGLEFATAEFSHPVRILTTTVKMCGGEPVPVRSNKPIPREKQFECMEEVRKISLTKSISQYDVIIADICGTGVDIVATKSVEV